VHPFSRRLIERSPRRLRTPVGLAIRTVDGAIRDRIPGLAAELAFWVLLSAPAILLTAIAIVSLVASDGSGWQMELIDRIVEVASVALTAQVIDSALRPLLVSLVEGTTLSVVSVAFLVSVWVASRAVKVVLVTVALTYGAEGPGGFAQRILGFVLTIVGLIVALVLTPLLVAGPNIGDQLVELGVGEGGVVAQTWRLLYWPVATLIATVAIASLYHVAAPWNTRWLRDLPGAVLATAGWLAGSAGLRLYGTWILSSDGTYGPLAGPIVGLLWVWLTGFAVLLGAELNAQIERRWPTRRHGNVAPSTLKRLASSTTGRFTPASLSPSTAAQPQAPSTAAQPEARAEAPPTVEGPAPPDHRRPVADQRRDPADPQPPTARRGERS
jgi:membrane protein